MSDDSTRLQTYERAIRVIVGCKTREHLEHARRYVRRFCEIYGEIPEGRQLWETINKVDRRLFPGDAIKLSRGVDRTAERRYI